MTERIYYQDSYLTSFRAVVAEAREDGTRLYLDKTLFYPASGGQPHDLGTLNGVPVIDVIDEEDGVAHVLASPLSDAEVVGEIDWPRRFDHMQQHSGQHLLSAVLAELFQFRDRQLSPRDGELPPSTWQLRRSAPRNWSAPSRGPTNWCSPTVPCR